MEHGQETYLEEEYAISPSYQESAAVCMGVDTLNKPRSTRWEESSSVGDPTDLILRTRKVCSKLWRPTHKGPERASVWTFMPWHLQGPSKLVGTCEKVEAKR